MNCQSNSVLAATLANNGTCPITGEKVFDADAVQHVRSLMYSCGMAIYSGQFAFNVCIKSSSLKWLEVSSFNVEVYVFCTVK